MNDSPRRRRLRFSLRTLVILVLLVGAGTGLKLHWAAWYPGVNISARGRWVFSSDSRYAAVLDESTGIRVYDIRNGTFGFVLPHYVLDCDIVSFSKEGKRLFVNTDGHFGNMERGEIYDVPSGIALQRSEVSFVVTSYEPVNIRFLDPVSFVIDFSRPGGDRSYYLWNHVPDSHLPILKQRLDKLARAEDIQEYSQIIRGVPELDTKEPEMNVYSSISRDGQTIVTSVYETGTLQLWTPRTGRRTRSVALPEKPPVVESTSFSRDGTLLAVFCPKFPTFIIDVSAGAVISQLPVSDKIGTFTADGSRFIVEHANVVDNSPGKVFRMEKTIKDYDYAIYETNTGGCIKRLVNEHNLMFSADGHRAGSVTSNGAELIDLNDDSTLLKISAQTLIWIAPDDEALAVSNNKNMQIWHRRRPERWWGVFWLPEFWLTLIFSCALIWSVRRDLRQA